jgi:acetyl esterase/lipase
MTILDCSYALSPEYPAPADIEDARDAFDYVLKSPDKYDASRITCSGFSAGGTVALGLSVDIGAEARAKAREDTFVHPIKAVMTFYPVATWLGEMPKVDIPSGPKDWPGMVFPDFIVDMMLSAHLFSPTLNSTLSPEQEQERIKALKSLPKVSPACADPNDFPPSVVIYTAEYDLLAGKANELRETLEKAGGREVSGKMVMKAGHGWDLDTREGTARHKDRVEAYETCIRAIAKVGGL